MKYNWTKLQVMKFYEIRVMKLKLVDHQITIVYVKFNDKNAGMITMQSDFLHASSSGYQS